MTTPKVDKSILDLGTGANQIPQNDGSGNLDADTLQGKTVGAGANQIPVRDGLGVLDADTLGGYSVGTGPNKIVLTDSSGAVPGTAFEKLSRVQGLGYFLTKNVIVNNTHMWVITHDPNSDGWVTNVPLFLKKVELSTGNVVASQAFPTKNTTPSTRAVAGELTFICSDDMQDLYVSVYFHEREYFSAPPNDGFSRNFTIYRINPTTLAFTEVDSYSWNIYNYVNQGDSFFKGICVGQNYAAWCYDEYTGNQPQDYKTHIRQIARSNNAVVSVNIVNGAGDVRITSIQALDGKFVFHLNDNGNNSVSQVTEGLTVVTELVPGTTLTAFIPTYNNTVVIDSSGNRVVGSTKDSISLTPSFVVNGQASQSTSNSLITVNLSTLSRSYYANFSTASGLSFVPVMGQNKIMQITSQVGDAFYRILTLT